MPLSIYYATFFVSFALFSAFHFIYHQPNGFITLREGRWHTTIYDALSQNTLITPLLRRSHLLR